MVACAGVIEMYKHRETTGQLPVCQGPRAGMEPAPKLVKAVRPRQGNPGLLETTDERTAIRLLAVNNSQWAWPSGAFAAPTKRVL